MNDKTAGIIAPRHPCEGTRISASPKAKRPENRAASKWVETDPKPDSVGAAAPGHHLSSSIVADGVDRPTLPDRAGHPQTRVYMAFQPAGFTPPTRRRAELWALTPLFSPLPPQSDGGIVSVALSVARQTGAFPLGSAAPRAVRTFLSAPWDAAMPDPFQYNKDTRFSAPVSVDLQPSALRGISSYNLPL